MPVTYGMQRAPVPGSSTGHPAQFLSNVGPVPKADYREQAVSAGVNYPLQVPRKTLSPYVPLPPFKEPGTFELSETMIQKSVLFGTK